MSALLGRAWFALDRWWFAPSQRYQLGVFRVLLLAWFGWFYSERLFARLRTISLRPVEFYDPPSLAAWLAVPPPPSWLPALEPWVLLLVGLALVGVATRVALIVLSLVNLLLGLWANAWGYTAHASALPALALCILAVAPGASDFSLESWWKRRASPVGRRPGAVAGERYGRSVWPVRALLVLLCLVYFAAGVSKLRASGMRWMDGATLGFYLGGGSPRGPGQVQRFIVDRSIAPAQRFRDGIGIVDHAYVGRPTPTGVWLSRQPGLLRMVSGGSLLWELLFPLALLGRRALLLALLGGLAFHVGIAVTLRINFASYLVCYAAFIDWRWVRASLDCWRRRLARVVRRQPGAAIGPHPAGSSRATRIERRESAPRSG